MSRTPKLLLLLLLFLSAVVLFLYLGLPGDTRIPPHAQFPGKISVILGQEESCMDCHGDMTGFAPAHAPRSIGCTPCHLGKPKEKDKDRAHRGMITVPGNLEDVYLTCGTKYCHQDIATRVKKSLMSTMAGVITVDRYAFGEIDTLTAYAHVKDLGFSAADTHLRHLCASCHLGNKKEHPGPVTERSRGGGCNACHLNYSEDALQAFREYDPGKEVPRVHPALTVEVRNDHCFGCHSRSGRISTNYEGWHETQLAEEEIAGRTGFRVLADRRVFQYVSEDIHHQRGLECVDCHQATELMGDGNTYLHEEDAVRIHCEDCHFSGVPSSIPFSGLDEESQKILALRKLPYQGHQFLVGVRSGLPYLNGWVNEAGEAFLVGKNDGEKFPLPAPSAVCSREQAHARLTCGACHTAWAPQCVGCHNTFEPEARAMDLLSKKRTKGKWVEYLGEFFAEPPSLGIVETLEEDSSRLEEIKTFIPGMIMTIDPSGFHNGASSAGAIFHRLFAPVAPHTTTTQGRTCKSCHNNPLALGYGRGRLEFDPDSRRWDFQPDYAASKYDGLPEDAWIGFLRESKGAATRPAARSLSVEEQRRVLTVGTCLTCHTENSKVMLNSLTDWEKVRKKMRPECMEPVGWE